MPMRWFSILILCLPLLAEAQPKGRRAAKAPDGKTTTVEAPARAAGPTLQRSNRVEFDARLVRGEKASGAVYLFQRAPRRLPALVDLKRDYLSRIVRPLLRRDVEPAE